MSLLSNLKKKRNEQMAAAVKSLERQSGFTKQSEDERFYRIKLNDKGDFNAIVRILPSLDDNLPWRHIIRYAFKGATGKWYIEQSPRAYNEKCPVSEYNYKKYGEGTEEAKQDCKKRKQNHRYMMRILIVRDPQNPELEGQVKFFDCGNQIFKLVEEQIKPEADEITGEVADPCFVWDAFEGKNLRLKAYGKQIPSNNGGTQTVPSFEKSYFEDSITALCGGDEAQMEAVLEKAAELDLDSLVEKKSYEELKKRFDAAMGFDSDKSSVERQEEEFEQMVETNEKKTKPKVEKVKKDEAADDDVSDLSYFEDLLK